MVRACLLFLMAAAHCVAPAAAQPVRAYAAGSLRAALTEAATAFAGHGGARVEFTFGPSGLLRDRLAKGEAADLFASANMEHPKALAEAGLADPVRMFARNRMCALAPARLGVTTANVLDRMLDPALKLGTSTPKADPSGDYAWRVFERAEMVRPGAYGSLTRKALQLAGGPHSPAPPKDRTIYGVLVAGGTADIFLTYCTNAVAAQREEPSLATIVLPVELEVGADYGLASMRNSVQGRAFAAFLLSDAGQRVLAAHGFSPPP